jgi:UDP-2-acetamido-3-amino-2,3-dideoxy-glucuronate N-acetyltransferase
MNSNEEKGIYIHPLADVEDGAALGDNTKIWRFTHVRAGSVIGENCSVGNNCYIDVDVTISDNVRIQNGVSVYKGVILEEGVFVGPNVTFTNDLYPRIGHLNWDIVPTRICKGASIGANATIICGVTINEYAMIGAGTVVTCDVARHRLVRGNPGRSVSYVCKCGNKLEAHHNPPQEFTLNCKRCGADIHITT